MLRSRRLFPVLLAALLLLAAGFVQPRPAFAQPDAPAESAKPQPPADKPVPAVKAEAVPAVRRVPILVDAQGGDPFTTKLAFQFKEAVRRSEGYRLASSGEQAFAVRLIGKVEFESRPHLGSALSVSWLFRERSDVLPVLLDDSVEFVDAATLQPLVDALMARTDKLADKYAYLFD